MGAARQALEGFLGGEDIAFDEVVAEDDADSVAVDEMLGQAQGVGDAAFAFLVGVVDVLEAEVAAVGEKPQKVARILTAGDDEDVGDGGVHQRLNGIENHRLVVDRQQVLVGDAGQRVEARAGAAGEDDAFHWRLP